MDIHTFSFKKIHLKMSSGKYRPFCFGLNVFKVIVLLETLVGFYLTLKICLFTLRAQHDLYHGVGYLLFVSHQ